MENLIQSGNGNVNQSFVNLLSKFNSILDMNAPLKKIAKEIVYNPWFTKISFFTYWIHKIEWSYREKVSSNINNINNRDTDCLLYWETVKNLTLQYTSKTTLMIWKMHGNFTSAWKTLISLRESPNIVPFTVNDNNQSSTKPQEMLLEMPMLLTNILPMQISKFNLPLNTLKTIFVSLPIDSTLAPSYIILTKYL